ncbi:MAG: hypothetical protein FWG25_07420 [Promicromonosporaceae bacterium]|nr:hypothetical protein [Promicromonosporaceae bacterium]
MVDMVPIRDAAEEAPRKQRDGVAVRRVEEPVPVRAWVTQRQSGSFEAQAVALAWTDRQVEIRYHDLHGRVGFAWLWASAVRREAA